MQFWLIYAALGAFVGFIAGLLGIGGGGVIVPVLVIVFGMQGVAHEHVMHIALATAMACIVFTSISSFREHHARGAVDWGIFRRITPGIILGGLLGSFVATRLPTNVLKIMFAVFRGGSSAPRFDPPYALASILRSPINQPQQRLARA